MPKPVSPESTADMVANPEHDRRLGRLSSAEDKARPWRKLKPVPSADIWQNCCAATGCTAPGLPPASPACNAKAKQELKPSCPWAHAA
jgi:hypothetical protein